MEINHPTKTQWRKWTRRLVLGLSLGGLLLLGVFFTLPWWLIRAAETAPADVILYLANGTKAGTDEYVVQLYQQGLSPQIVCVSGQITWQTFPADFTCERLRKLGVPATATSALHLPRLECGADYARVLLGFLQQRGVKRVLIVTHPASSRATARLLAERFARAQIALTITYSPTDYEDFQGAWWREHRSTQKLVQEGIETIVDWFYPSCW